jgi:hypothetical protein
VEELPPTPSPSGDASSFSERIMPCLRRFVWKDGWNIAGDCPFKRRMVVDAVMDN